MNKNLYIIRTLVVLFLSITSFTVNAQSLKLANVFGDHMVLQREKKVPVWGTSNPKENITVKFSGQTKTTKSDRHGKWMIYLDPLKTSFEGKDMIVEGDKNLVIKDILVGEVWICAGQSNMVMSYNSSAEVRGLVPLAKNIRSFFVENNVALKEQHEASGKWKVTHPKSAVAFSFAYFLNNLGNVPVGIIQASWGSSSIEAWMPRSMTKEVPHFKTIMQEFDADKERVARIQKLIHKENWTRDENIFLRRNSNIIYNAMMHPLIPFANRGLVWYQGERNTRYIEGLPEAEGANWFHRVCGMKDYDEVLKKWIQTYRKNWNDDEMHFMVVMLPGYGKGTQAKQQIDVESPTEESWAWMRESQLSATEISNVSVVNTIDLGDVKNIHPTDKLPIGQRTALLAAKKTLNVKGESQGPIFKKVEVLQGKLMVHFNHAVGLKTTNGKAPSGFWITDDSQKWVKATAKLEGETVLLSSPEVKNPKYIRYAFSGKPTVNLVNKSELPAYPFRTDIWEE
ncbi:sialate O-acetylesterase [Polaribacter vadi]|uniref:sialate O-acetylesterase n=1 Tax=Polaribacter TaxID=52959 RepID=UPI001C083A2F|nr:MULTISPECIES: sialate O-acetylesterase [Polaribacter]MBU3011316.1 sialate O-acetylesterase [Polaribacter vadi]MDO6741128.1 sialate O-acetylesterase [Polaribacter sp. 1_MG-2023]